MNEITKTEAAEIAAILQSYINVCGITQYVEPIARDFNVINKIECDYRLCNLHGKQATQKDGRRYLVSDTNYRDLRFPDRNRVLIFCDLPHALKGYFNEGNFWEWCKSQKLAGHIVVIKNYYAPFGIKIWHDATDAEKLFIFGGLTNAENTRS